MKEYKIIRKEELVSNFYIEANSPEEALEKYKEKVGNGKIDFEDMTLISCENENTVDMDNVKENENYPEHEFSDLYLEFWELDLSIYPVAICSYSPEAIEMGPYLNMIKVDKSIFDDYQKNVVIQISFVDLPHSHWVYDYIMIDEDDDWIWMEQI